MIQQVYLISNDIQFKKNHRRRRIHMAQREGVRGRRLTVNPRCQIYLPYFENYTVLTDLHSLGEELTGWALCRHCCPHGRSDLPIRAFTDIRANIADGFRGVSLREHGLIKAG